MQKITLCPMPKSMQLLPGTFRYNKTLVDIHITPEKGEVYTLAITEKGIRIEGGEAGVFYAQETLKQLLQAGDNLPCLKIEDSPALQVRGVYLDVTRGKVPTLATLKRTVDRLASYKINQLQLYVEDCVLFDSAPALRHPSPLTKDEIRALDAYCRERHIDLVPSLSTFGHLFNLLECPEYKHLRELPELTDGPDMYWIHKMAHHTLDVSQEESFTLISAIIDEYTALFSSGTFNICCDETFDLGNGKNKELAAKVGKGKLYSDFLLRLITHVKSKGKTVQFWGDILLEHPEFLEVIPEGCIFLNWDYEKNTPEEKTKTFAKTNVQQLLCSGTSGWNRFANNYDIAFKNIEISTAYAVKYNTLGTLCTDWGDFGHINQLTYSIPPLAYSLSLAWNPETEEPIKAISQLEFGSDEAIDILWQACNKDGFNWSNAVMLHNLRTNQISDTKDFLYNIKVLEALNPEAVQERISELAALKERVTAKYAEDKEELRMAIEGEIFLCRLSLHFITGQDITAETEGFLQNFQAVWLKHNKIADLPRVCTLIRRMAGIETVA